MWIIVAAVAARTTEEICCQEDKDICESVLVQGRVGKNRGANEGEEPEREIAEEFCCEEDKDICKSILLQG